MALRKADIGRIWRGESVIVTGWVGSVVSFSFLSCASCALFFDRNADLCWEAYTILRQLSTRMTVSRIHRWIVLMFPYVVMRGGGLFLQLTRSRCTCVSPSWMFWYWIVTFFVWNLAPGRFFFFLSQTSHLYYGLLHRWRG